LWVFIVPQAKFAQSKCWHWCCALLLAFACHASFAAPAHSLRFSHLGVEQGLAQESVLAMVQDRQGFMWFGTQAGLSRSDGYRMTLYKNDPGEPTSLVDNYVLAAFEDERGELWFGTKGGLTRFDRINQRFVRYAPNGAATGNTANRSVFAILSDGNTGLWVATGDGLKHVDTRTGTFTEYRHDAKNPDSIADDRLSSLAIDNAGNLWIGTGSGLERMVKGSKQFDHFSLAKTSDAGGKQHGVLSLSAGGIDNVLWVGTTGGLEAWKLGPDAPQRLPSSATAGVGTVRVLSMYRDHDQNLWLGSDTDGLKWRDPASGVFVSYRHQLLDRHSLADNQVSSLHQDRTGTLWVGTWYAGVDRVDLASGGFERFSMNAGDLKGLSSNKIRSIDSDGKGKLWLATSGGGLNHFDPVTGLADVLRHDPQNSGSLPDDMLTAVEAVEGRVWVGAQTGLSWLDPATGKFTQLPLGPDPVSNYIQRLRVDRAGSLWVLTRGGLHRVDNGKLAQSWRHDANDPGSLGENWGFSLLEDRRGILWVGTDHGLDRFDRSTGKFTHFRHDPRNPGSLTHNRVHHMLEARNGTLWVGTAGGLNRLDRGNDGQVRFQYYALSHSRAADPVGSIMEDQAGMLWVSTTAGVSRLDPVNGQFKNYTSKDGLIDGSYFVGSGHRDDNGTVYFGGLNGLTAFTPKTIHDNPHPPAILITDFLVFNQSVRNPIVGESLGLQGPIHEAKELTLSARDSVFSFEFAALHFADPLRNRYAYQLEGFDQGWMDTDATKRFASYTNLDPGEYTFRVKASNKDGVWSQAAAVMKLTITPPVYKTWWFRLMTAALVLGLVYAGFRIRIRALLQQKNVLEDQVTARTAELQLQKESIERQHQTVQTAHRNISLLSDIGRTLTANLDTEAIMLMLYSHVNELMDASVFGIGFYRPERCVIDYPFAIEMGKRYAPYSRTMSDPNQMAVWCIRHEREIFINDLQAEYTNFIEHLGLTSSSEHLGTLDDGSLPTAPQSMLYVPISVNGRMVGVISVHSYHKNAYEQIHLDMLRTLASYVGVAFDNADAYRQLKDTQQQLVAQEKLAALGSLVAGVAHELNTPIGNSLLMASALQEKTDEVSIKFEDQTIKRSDLHSFIGASQEASALIMRSLRNAADLVNSFKQVAVDQASAQRREFNLEQASNEIVATMMNQVRKAGHLVEYDIPSDIVMDSFPGPYGQVLINFVNNALLHAFGERTGGRMLIKATTMVPGRVLLAFSDDGAGIDPENLARIFDPFFTTKMGQGGSGLGLNITYNIVTSLLGGSVRVESVLGTGTTFYIDLPQVAPNAPT
jgi:ligand-binding sensor domain-containing protein/signal transduction histidine kinase